MRVCEGLCARLAKSDKVLSVPLLVEKRGCERMSDPVSATGAAPTFGGLSGYKRPALGRPTSVPSGLPAFRGRTNKPGDQVRTPTIVASKNRHDRGTNVTIPYARICPIDHLANVGRISPGDVVFTSRFRVAMHHVATQREQRIVGVDFLNRALGNDNKTRVPGSPIHPNWVVGETVLLGGNSAGGLGAGAQNDGIGAAIADNWREASFLREWICDGIVISNDEPYAHSSNGSRDVQLFNICVQGRSACNNGYVDFAGRGVESSHRSANDRNGYKDDGEPLRSHDFGTAIGGPYYQSYPLQMFDRKIKPLSNVYVGLVATKRTMNAQVKAALLANSKLATNSRDYFKLTTQDEDNLYETFYTFKFVYFSDRAMWQQAANLGAPVLAGAGGGDDWAYAEPPMKKQRPVHHDDALLDPVNKSFDQFEPCSLADYRGMVGAWRIGKVLDTAASRRDQYMGGPVDTADQITVNVNLEWVDWRALRRVTERIDIGGWVSGAPIWMGNTIPVLDGAGNVVRYADTDDGRTLMWPTEYTPARPGATPAETTLALRKNFPLDMATLDTVQKVRAQAAIEANPAAPGTSHAREGYGQIAPRATEGDPRGLFTLTTIQDTQLNDYRASADSSWLYAGDDNQPLGIQRRIEALRRLDTDPRMITDVEYDIMWNSKSGIAGGFGTPPRIDQFEDWFANLDATDPVQLFYIQLIEGSQQVPDAATWASPGYQMAFRRAIAQYHYEKARFFTNGARRVTRISKEVFRRYIDAKASDATGFTPSQLANVASSLQEGIDRVITIARRNDMSRGDAEATLAAAATAGTFSDTATAAAAAPANASSSSSATPSSNPMDTGAGVGLSFGISAAPAAASASKGKAPMRRKPDAPTAPTAPTAAPMDTSGAVAATVAAPPAPKAAPKPVAAPAAPTEPAAAPPQRSGRPGAAARTQRPGVQGTEEIFSSIFGSSAPAGGAASAAPAGGAADNDSDASSDHAPSPAAGSNAGARSRVRRARDGR